MVLAETEKSRRERDRGVHGAQGEHPVQEFIKRPVATSAARVVGGKVIAAMKRQGKPGEFRSNLHRGGSATLIA